TESTALALHDALPICERLKEMKPKQAEKKELTESERREALKFLKSGNLIQKTKEAIAASDVIGEESNALIAYHVAGRYRFLGLLDRKSTRLNSSHVKT